MIVVQEQMILLLASEDSVEQGQAGPILQRRLVPEAVCVG